VYGATPKLRRQDWGFNPGSGAGARLAAVLALLPANVNIHKDPKDHKDHKDHKETRAR